MSLTAKANWTEIIAERATMVDYFDRMPMKRLGEIYRTARARGMDLVTITRATWKRGPGKLIVEALSDQQPQVTLTVEGLGPMTWNPDTSKYSYTSPNKTPNPGSVTVTSSGGGSATASVQ